MSNPIVLLCPRTDHACTHVSVLAFDDRLELFYGEKTQDGFSSTAVEEVRYSEEPELRGIWDGIAWDIRMLVNLVEECCE